MQQLHPKAVWPFFISFLIAGIFIFFFLGIWILPLLLGVAAGAAGLGATGIFISLIGFVFLLVIYVAFCYFWAHLTYNNWRYQFTEDAVRIEKGVIWKKYISIPYERVQNVDIYRGLLARLLGLSDLQIQTAGYSSYGKHGSGSEGRLPGLDPQIAEQLRDELIKRAKGTRQGL